MKRHMLESAKILGEIRRCRYEKIPYEERNTGLVSKFEMEHGCGLKSSMKVDGGGRQLWSKRK